MPFYVSFCPFLVGFTFCFPLKGQCIGALYPMDFELLPFFSLGLHVFSTYSISLTKHFKPNRMDLLVTVNASDEVMRLNFSLYLLLDFSVMLGLN